MSTSTNLLCLPAAQSQEQLLENREGIKYIDLPQMPGRGGDGGHHPCSQEPPRPEGSRETGQNGKGESGKEYLLGWSISRHGCRRFLGPEKCIYRRCRIFFSSPFFCASGSEPAISSTWPGHLSSPIRVSKATAHPPAVPATFIFHIPSNKSAVLGGKKGYRLQIASADKRC